MHPNLTKENHVLKQVYEYATDGEALIKTAQQWSEGSKYN